MAESNLPKISVVIAAYNAAGYLPTTLGSICAQTFGDFEVIVVNDGSTDDSASVLKRLAENDSRILPINLPGNVGRSAARNHGLDMARGEWICPTDADDLWQKRRLAAFVEATEQYPTFDCFTDDLIEFRVGKAGDISLGHRFASRVTWRLGGNHVLKLAPWYTDRDCHMTPFIRRTFLEEHGIRFPEGFSSGEDIAFCLFLAFAPGAKPPVRVAEPNYLYRRGESLHTANMAESRVLLSQLVIDKTGNPEFADLVKRKGPGNVFASARGDRKHIERGQARDRDEVVAGVELEMDAVAGYAKLIRVKLIEILSKIADRHLRPAIKADIARQIAEYGAPEVPNPAS